MSTTTRSGTFFGVGAYVWWGLSPAFFVLLLPATAAEILAHRIVWSALFLLVVLIVARRIKDLGRLSGRTWLQLVTASALVSINWGVYIYAVTSGQVVDAALGYFINPLISVALGVLVFRERLNRWQLVALMVAVAAVVVLTTGVGAPPWIAFALALSWAFYGLVKKLVTADPRVSVAVETMIALPFAGGFLIVLAVLDRSTFFELGPGHAVLLLLAGPATAIPLLLFSAAAQRLPLITLGMLFYVNPGLQLAFGVLVNEEPMPVVRWVGFVLIWVSLAVLSVDALRRRKAPALDDVAAVDPGSASR